MSKRDDHADRRQFGRRHSRSHAWIKLPGRPAMACMIRNVSDGGALLIFDRPELLPFAFLLSIEGESQYRGCEVRHHYGDRVGVAFVEMALVSNSLKAFDLTGTGSWIGPREASRPQ
jgi:hypothetical protein